MEYKKREEEKEKKGRVECNGSRFRPVDRPTDRNIKQTSLTVTRSQWCDMRESPVDGVTVCVGKASARFFLLLLLWLILMLLLLLLLLFVGGA